MLELPLPVLGIISLALFKELDGLRDEFPGLVGSFICLMRETQVDIGLGQSSFSPDLFCKLNRLVEMSFCLFCNKWDMFD